MIENMNVEKFRAKYRAVIDEYFKESMDNIKKYVDWSSENVENVKNKYEFYQNRDVKVITVEDIQLVYSTIGLLAYQSYFSFFYIYRAMEDMKEITQLILEIPLGMLEGALPEVMKQLNEKLETQRKELKTLREDGVEIALKVEGEFRNDIKRIIKRMEDAMKAMEKYVV